MRRFLLAQTTKLASTSGTILGNRGYLPNKRFRRTTKATLSVIACVLCLSLVLGSTAYTAELVADSTSYEIGSTITIEGFSFEPGETVTVAITELDGTPINGPGGEPWMVTSDGIGDFSTTFVLDYEGTSEELLLNAVGETSGLTASTTFLVPPTNLDQLQNGTATSPPEWSNGNINGNNSCYSEGRSVPYRAFISNTTAGTSHYFTIEMDWTRATIHAIDYLTSYDITEDSAIWLAGGPCGDSGATAPDGCSVPTDSLVMPDPTDSANYSGTIPPDFFTLVNTDFVYDVDQYLMANNAIIDSVGDYRFGGTASNTTLALEVYFTTDTTGSVGVFWGGHLAEGNDDGWGIGNGSASISGAPYHMQIKSLDGGGVAAQSASIQNGTICLPPSPLIVCDVDTVCADTFSTYVCYDTSSAGDWLWSVTNGTIIGDNTLDSVVFYVTPGVNPGETVTVQLTACNVDGGCPGDVCCTDVSMTLPVISCNNPPEVYCADPVSFFLCELEEICITGFSCYDSDDNLDSCYVNMGVLSGDTVCFTPTGAGIHEIILTAVDAYNQVAVCTTTVTITLNSAPVVSCPPADTMFVCGLSDICVSGFSSSDVDNNLASCQVSLGTLDDDSVCFTPVVGTNTIEYICIDSCGLADTCEVEIDVVLNSPPVASAGSDQSVFQCTPAEICWAASCSDLDGNLSTCDLISGPGTYNGSNICFTPSGTGSYLFVLRATDACSETDDDSVTIDVTINSAPTVVAQDDTALFLCTPQEICVTYVPGDPDGLAGLTETMLSGYGSIDTANNKICFTPTSDGVYEFTVGVTDVCNETDQDIVVVTVTFGDATSITCPTEAISKFLCAAGSVSEPLTITPDTARVSTSFGSYAGGNVQFQADTAGTYIITVISEVECDADTCEITFDVVFNSPPVADAGADQTLFQCTPTEICWAASYSDPDGNETGGELVSGPGTYDGSDICFTPSGSGSYLFVFRATDACSETDDDSVTIDVTINSTPTVVAQDDTALFLCTPQEICVSYVPGDPDGLAGLTEIMVSGYGSIDTANNEICFTPTSGGVYEFTVGATDDCNETDQDIVVVTVTFGDVAEIDCPIGIFDISLCDADSIIQILDIIPDSATVTVSYGIYDEGAVRFLADTAGIYVIQVIAAVQCGADTCEMTFDVEIGQMATISCPDPQDIFLCTAGNVSVPVSINGSGVTVTVSPIGTYDNGTVIFPADTSGHYEIKVLAETPCGDDSCIIEADITINSAPIANDPGAAVDTFMCAAAQICYQFGATDVDGGTLTWTRISGAGTVDASGNWCFDGTEGTFAVMAEVTDSCGAADTVSHTYNVDINSTPVVTLDNDTTIVLCNGSQFCFGYGITDDDNNVTLEQLIAGTGTLDTVTNEICFTPTSAGVYSFTVRATDSCGAYHEDTIEITVEIGTSVVLTCPDPLTVFLCAAETICRPVTVTPSGADVVVTPIGTYAAGEVCFMADTAGFYELTVIATSPCGADTCSFTVDVTLNSPPIVDDPGTAVDTFMCAADQICYQFGATDVDGGPLTWTRISGAGTVDASGNWCFNGTEGTFVVMAEVTDSCNATDTVSHTYNVVINSAPVADDPGAAVDTFMCAAVQICYQFGATDVDGGTLTWTRISGAGTVDASGNWCFDGAEGSWTVTAEVTDSCGATNMVSHTYNVDINSTPVVTLDNDTTIILCDGSQYCFGYEIADDDNNVTLEQLMAGTGTLDTVANEICFTPTSAGVYSFTVRATDNCGAYHEDTIEITVEIGTSVVLTCPDPLTVFLCAAETICRPVTVTPSGADVVVTPIGTYAAGEVCFMADTAGFYELTVIATSPCGADTCSFTVDVTINSAPIADDPGAEVDTFLCATDQICYQFGATDIDGGPLTWTQISGAGTVDVSGNWCFDANATGSYTVVVAVEDSCEVADTTSKTYNVTLNSDPTIVLGNDTSLFLCAFTQICFDYIVADADNNIVNEECLVGGATMDTVANTFCFVPDTVGTYRFILRVTDSCGASDTDTIDVIVGLNSPPIADAGEDIDLFHCDPSEVCFPVSCSDPDDNLDTCYIVDGPGLASRSDICFTPDTSGVYQFILRALDECGEFDDDTILVTVTLNTAPVCELPSDSTFFQCVLTQVSLPVGATDIDGNFDSCEIVSGPGSIVGGFWVYTPAVEEVDTIVIRCYDSCQASCEGSFIATFTINSPPVADAGDDAAYFFCEPGSTLCWPASCSDPDDNLVSCNLISAHGTYDSNDEEICFQVPSGDGSYIFVMEAVDACGLKHYDTATISIVMNHPPTIQMEDSLTLFQSDTGYVCFYAEIFDEDGNLNPDSIIVIPDAEYIEGTGICFTVDTAGWYVFEVYAGDSCGAWASDSIFVEIEIDNCIHARIEKVHDAYQGRHTIMNVYLDGVGKALGGFDFLLAYDETALLPGVVEPGQLFESCGWEYFAYRYGDNGNCGNACPSGLLRIVGIAETNNGPNHPGCYLQGTNGILATVDFLVTNDRTYECQFAPVSFFWADCNDNSFSSQSGDILYVSRSIYTFELYPIHDYTFGVPGYFGVHDSCLAGEGPDKPKPERCVDFTNGGIDIICADSIDARGDMNLNGIAYEVADAVVYANYFIYGLSAFSVNVEGQIAASDVNADGLSLTVGDMVYLIRVVVGDAPPVPKLDPNAVVKAEFAVEGDVVSITKTDLRIGAIFLLIDGQAEPSIHENANSMEMSYHYDGTSTRVLIYDMSGDSYLESGPIMHLNGRHTINSVEVGGYDGLNIVGKIDNLPESFTLSQNYPNPFNPTTTIKFALPIASEWELTIYNILGNQVEQFNGKAEAGYQELRWDAVEHSSGVYFYRLKAGGFTASKRMVLLK